MLVPCLGIPYTPQGGLIARRRSFLALSAEHARQALAVLIHDGKVAASEVQKALKRHRHLVSDLRASLAALEAGVGKVGHRVLKDGPSPMGPKAKTASRKVARRKPRISAATRKMYQQQGRYMAAVRQLPKAGRAKIKAIREISGVLAAIAAARRWPVKRRLGLTSQESSVRSPSERRRPPRPDRPR